ncbi:MAG TPA: M67 family metallopeptidase [Rhizomicrobium sp.]|nr:M67 family metallopeptidase [Rhizomicrobium sp.]
MRVSLPPGLRRQILREAETAHPRECCGLLQGNRNGTDFCITALHPARNLAAAPDRFDMEPKDQFDAYRSARRQGQAVIGCYHSHPNGSGVPSATDRAGAGEENFLWLIAAGESVNAFVYRDGSFLGADWVTSSE